jgi:hypothetical protein
VGVELLPHAFVKIPDEKMNFGVILILFLFGYFSIFLFIYLFKYIHILYL